MNRYDLLKYFIDKIESYEKEAESPNDLSIEGFNDWMYKNFLKERNSQTNKVPSFESTNIKDINLSVLIGTLYRYVKGYSKKVLDNSKVQSLDEFSYLASLIDYGKMTKSELISLNVHEKTTGMEIIKRLIMNKLIMQTNDPSDKRSHIIELTKSGEKEIIKLFVEMSKVSTLVGGKLSDQEKVILLFLLEKLDIFHRYLFDHEKKTEIENLITKYINKNAK